MQGEKRRFLLLILLDVIISILDIASLAILLWLVQWYINPAAVKNMGLLSVPPEINAVWPLTIFCLLFALKNAAGYYVNGLAYRFNSSLALRISTNNLLHYQQSSFSDFTGTDSSQHIKRISFYPYEFTQFVVAGVQQTLTQSFLILLTIIAILVFDARLFLVLLTLLLPPALLIFWFVKKRSEQSRNRIQASNENSYRYLNEALKGYAEANLYGKNRFFRERFIEQRAIFSTTLFRFLHLQTLPGRLVEVFAVLGLFILILVAQWYQREASLLVLIGAFMAAAYKIIPGLVKIINATGQVRAYAPALKYLKETGPAMEKVSPVAVGSVESLEMKGIRFSHGDKEIVKGFDLFAQKGDLLGIKGVSGKGKTTVLNMIAGLLQPAEGEVRINGESLDANGIKNYWPRMAYVRQQVFLIHDTVLKNIVLGNSYDEHKLKEAIRAAGIDQWNDGEGLEKMVTENGRNISGGQQQRIALARAVYHDADLFLLDEPFNELDEESEKKLLVHFKELAANGRIVIMVTHGTRALSYCNKIISVDDGEG